MSTPIAVTSTAAQIIAARIAAVVTLRNIGAVTAYIDFDDTTALVAGNGMPIAAGEMLVVRMPEWRPAIYAKTASGTTTLFSQPGIDASSGGVPGGASGAATEAAQTTGNASLSSIATNTTLTNGRLLNEPLRVPGVSRDLAAGASSANTALTTTCRSATIYASGADIRFLVGSTSQTALATSHFIASGERLDIALPATPNIAVLRNASTSGTLMMTEWL